MTSSVFFDAIKKGSLTEIEDLLSVNPGLIHEKEDELSPIMVAMYSRQLKAAELLSEKTVALTIFESAAMGKLNQVVRHLARDPRLVNSYSNDGFQPLGLACFFGHRETAEYLIKAGATINFPSQNLLGATPIHSATTAGHVDIVLLLLNHDANPNAREGNGFTPLHIAAQNGDAPMLRALLFNGADMSVHNYQGKLAMDLAIEAGHGSAVAVLKEGITRRFKHYNLNSTKS